MTLTILGKPVSGRMQLTVYASRVSADFPSPAAAHLGVISPSMSSSTYVPLTCTWCMQGAGIFSGDLLIVDRSKEAEHGDIVIAAINAEHVCKRLHRRDGAVILQSENPASPPLMSPYSAWLDENATMPCGRSFSLAWK